MDKQTLKVIEHIRIHTAHPEINSIQDAVQVLLDIFTSDDKGNIDIQQCPKCQNCLAIGLWRNTNGVRDNAKAYELLLEASKAGFAKAQTNLGIVIVDKILNKPDYRAARFWFEKAAEQGDTIAKEKLNKYKNLFPTVLTEQVHGDHISASCFDDIKDVISKTLKNGTNVKKTETFMYDELGYPEYRTVFSLESGNEEVETRALIVTRDETNEFISLYPRIKGGAIYEVEIDNIYEWDNGIEAIISGYIEDKHVSFFMTDYYLYKNDIKQGDLHKFKLSAFAYNCSTLKEHSFKFEGQQAVDYLMKLGEKPKIDSNGDIEPVVFNLDNLVAFLQVNEKYPDDVEYQSPILSYKEVNTNGGKLYKFELTAFRDPDIIVPMYVKSDKIDFVPQIDLPVRGCGWLVGSLDD